MNDFIRSVNKGGGKFQDPKTRSGLIERLRSAARELRHYGDEERFKALASHEAGAAGPERALGTVIADPITEQQKKDYHTAVQLYNEAIALCSKMEDCAKKCSIHLLKSDTQFLKRLEADRRKVAATIPRPVPSPARGHSFRAQVPSVAESDRYADDGDDVPVTDQVCNLATMWGIARGDITSGDGLRVAVSNGDIVRAPQSADSEDTFVSVAYSVFLPCTKCGCFCKPDAHTAPTAKDSSRALPCHATTCRPRTGARIVAGGGARTIPRYFWRLSTKEVQHKVRDGNAIEFLPRPKQMTVVHDFRADRPSQLGYGKHAGTAYVAYTACVDRPTTVELDAIQVVSYYKAGTAEEDEPQLHSYYCESESETTGLLEAGTTVVVIDHKPSSPWVVGFRADNPEELGEIPSSFLTEAPKIPETSTMLSVDDKLPSQRALSDANDEDQEDTVGAEAADSDQTLLEFELDLRGFPSLHRDGVDLYTRAFLCELLSLFVGAYVYASANAIDLDGIGQADAGDSTLGMVALMVGQFVFIMADRAVYLTQSIRAKIMLVWLSLSVYLALIFGTFSAYTPPTCEEGQSDSVTAFCKDGTLDSSMTWMRIIGAGGLLLGATMRWSFLSSSRDRSLLGGTGGMIEQVIWSGFITIDDLAVIIQAFESLSVVALVYASMSTNRDRTFSEVLFFCLKTYYWYLSAEQIRYGYKVEAGKLNAQLLTSKTTMSYHYAYLAWTTMPFVNEIRTAWDWTWCQTTLEYFDAVKLDQMQRFTYMAHCRLQRLHETGRGLGQTQLNVYRFMYGSIFAVVFTGSLWGPMLLFTGSIDFHTHNVNDAALTVELQLNRLTVKLAEFTLHETIPMGGASDTANFEENAMLFSDAAEDGTQDSYALKNMYLESGVGYEQATSFWSRKDTYVEQIQSVVTGKYPSQAWRATTHTRRQIVADLNATLAKRSVNEPDKVAQEPQACDVPGTVCLIFSLSFEKSSIVRDATTMPGTAQTLKFPENIVLGWETAANLVSAINATLAADRTAAATTDDLGEVVIDGAILPLIILKHDGTKLPVSPEEEAGSRSVPRIPFKLALKAESAQEWYWTVSTTGPIGTSLLGDEFTRRKHCGGMTADMCSDTWGLALAVLNDKYPTDGSYFAVLEIGIYAIYATFIYAIASAYKLWTYKTMRDILLTDMDRVKFLWSKIQDINTARALAKRNTEYFMVEEKLWWDLHSIFRDPAKLYAVSSRPSSVSVVVGVWDGHGVMEETTHIDMSFMASVFELRNRACRQLNCGAGSRYELWRYNRWNRAPYTDGRLCGSAMAIAMVSEGESTLWNAGVIDNDTLCLKRYDPKPAEAKSARLLRSHSSESELSPTYGPLSSDSDDDDHHGRLPRLGARAPSTPDPASIAKYLRDQASISDGDLGSSPRGSSAPVHPPASLGAMVPRAGAMPTPSGLASWGATDGSASPSSVTFQETRHL